MPVPTRFRLAIVLVPLLLIIGSAPAFAQTVLRGTITDRSTGTALPGVQVQANCGATTTDASGVYAFSIQQVCNTTTGRLTVRATGYYTVQTPYTITAAPTTVDVGLLAGGTVMQGTITDGGTQAGVEGANLTLCVPFADAARLPDFRQCVFATTVAGGHYSIDSSQFLEGAAEGFDIYNVVANHSAYFTYQAYNNGAPLFRVAAPFPFTHDFTMVPASGMVLQGTVTNRVDGAPISGASVQVNCGSTVTDATGKYSFTATQVCNTPSGRLTVRATGFYTVQTPYTITTAPTTVDVSLAAGGALLQGTVSDGSTQAGVEGANVSLCVPFADAARLPDFRQCVFATTGAGGHYSIDSSQFLEGAAEGFDVFSVHANHSAYFAYQAYNNGATLFRVAAPFPFTHDFSMVPASGMVLQGTVTNRVDGAPISGASVQVNCGATVTDATGQYSFTAPQVCNSTSGRLTVRATGFYTVQTPYTITTAPTTVDVGLLAGGTVMQGTITDGGTQAGVEGANLTLCVPFADAARLPDFRQCVFATTVAGGHYSIDSSQFLEGAAEGFDVSYVFASHGAYFNYQQYNNGTTLFRVSAPFPFTHDISMSSTGVATRSVTIATLPAGLAIVVDGAPSLAPQVFAWFPGDSHSIGTMSPQEGAAGTRYVLTNWSDGGAIAHAVVVPSTDTAYTASFRTQYLLTTGATPATAGSTTAGDWKDAGSNVTVTATPAAGYRFDHFSGDVSSTSNPVTLAMNGPAAVVAHFVPLSAATTTSVSSTINPAPHGSSVTFIATVTSAAGTPAGTVTFRDGVATIGSATLGASGVATLTTSALAIGSHAITATYDGTATFDSSDGTLTEIITALASNYVLQGRVLDRITGAPIAGANVHVYNGGAATVQSDAGGQYFVTGVQFPSTTGSLFVDAPGYFSVQWLSFSDAPRAIDIMLLPGGPVVRGRVGDAATGAPIAGAGVTYSGSNTYQWGPTVRSTASDVNGEYTLDSWQFTEAAAASGTQGGLQIVRSGYVSASRPVQAGAPYPLVVDVTLTSGNEVLLQGTIRNRATGAPIAGANVHVYGGGVAEVKTDVNGHYSVTGNQYPATSGSLFVDAPGFYSVQWLAFSGAPATVDVTMADAGAVLQGTLRDSSTGAPIDGAAITYSGTNTYQWGPTVRSTVSGAGGFYRFDASQFVEAAATAGTQGGLQINKQGYISTAASVNATPPFPYARDFNLVPGGVVVVQGTVTNRSTGAPIPGANVHVYNGAAVNVQTDANGHYSVTGTQFPSTSGSVFVDVPGYYSVQWRPFNGAPTATVDLDLLPGGPVLQGTVRDAVTGAAIGDASITFSGGNTYQWGPTVRSTLSDASGGYAFDSSQFVEAAATSGTQGSLLFQAPPSYFGANVSVNSTPPFPGTFDVDLTPTGATVSVTVGTNSPGAAFQVDGVTYTSPQSFTWVPHNPHVIATDSPQAATADTRAAFSHWSDGRAISHTIITPGSAAAFTASFVTEYLLIATADPAAAGSVAGGWMAANSAVTVTATPGQGYRFSSFSGDLLGSTNPQTLVMSGPRSVTAHFTELAPIDRATPVITWPAPAGIVFGTPIDSSQLNATASVNGTSIPGTFEYTPPSGTLLAPGMGQMLQVAFTPTDSARYTTAAATVAIDVVELPEIALTAPTDTIYDRDSVVIAEYTCQRALTCIGTVASGSALDTSEPGFKTFTVTATDALGNVTSESVTYMVSLGACVQPFAGLTAWLAADFGTTMDTVSRTFAVPLHNGNGAGYTNGMVGHAFSMAGNDPFSLPFEQVGPFTLQAWISTPNRLDPEFTGVISTGGPGQHATSLQLELDGTGNYRLNVGDSEASWLIGPALDTFQHVAVTFDGSMIAVYLNGQLVQSDASTGTSGIGFHALNLAVDRDGSRRFTGIIDEVQVFNRALSETEVAQTYSAGAEGFCRNHSPISVLTISPRVAEATGPGGAMVTLDGAASSDPDGDPLTYTWRELTGSLPIIATTSVATLEFGVGSHTVTLSVSDGVTPPGGSKGVFVVQDTTAPALTIPGEITAEATSAAGATVTFAASASDLADGATAVDCSPASGSLFAMGTTTVTCSSADARQNAGSRLFTITVVDTAGPVLALPGDVIAEAIDPLGAAVAYTASATDAVSGTASVTCAPASGSRFAIGTTRVDCTTADADGNASTGGFTVIVRDTLAPAAQVTSPSTDAALFAPSVDVIVQAGDSVGVTAVTVNGVGASQTGGTPQSGTWRATVPVTVPVVTGGVLRFDAVASDAAGNGAAATLLVDSDGIPKAMDRDRTGGVDRSGSYTNDFNNDVTAGTLARNGWVATLSSAPAAGGVRTTISGAGAAPAVISACIGGKKDVRLDVSGETADVTCNPVTGSITVTAFSAVPKIQLREQLTNGMWQQFVLRNKQSMTVGSPATAAADNTEPIDVEILQIDANGNETVVGAYQLAPGASVDVTATTDAAGRVDVRFEVLSGTVTATVSGETRTLAQGEQFTMPVDGPLKIRPTMTWATPADIVSGTPLGVTQLNATANVTGTFVYTPAAGTVLPPGPAQTLSVTFLPADAVNYTTATAMVSITVHANNTVSTSDLAIVEGNATGATKQAWVTVKLAQKSTAWVSLAYATSDGTAQRNTDYFAVSATVWFAPGDVSQSVAIPIVQDTVGEPTEVFFVDFSGMVNGVAGHARAAITITNDDNTVLAVATAADFAAGTLGGAGYISETLDGEIILAPRGSEFSGSSLPEGWTPTQLAPNAIVTVADGKLLISGGSLMSPAIAASGDTLEFAAIFSKSPDQRVGLSASSDGVSPMAMFMIKNDGQLYARTVNGGRVVESLMAGIDWLGKSHQYKIAWTTGGAQYYVDGVLMISHGSMAWGALTMRPLIVDSTSGDGGVSVDWLRLTPYAPSGSYTSAVLDVAGAVLWQKLTTVGSVPSGTTVTMTYRTGNTPVPDSSWTAFAVPVGGALAGTSRYLQFAVQLGSTSASKTPVVQGVTVQFKR